MKLRIVSDLHTEFHADRGNALLAEVTSGEYDVLVVAGDLADAERLPGALRLLARGTKGRPIVYVSGNHEFHGPAGERSEVLSIVRGVKETYPHLNFLNTEFVDIDGVRFLGTTLWFREKTGPEWSMNDFASIPNFKEWVYRENRLALRFLEHHLSSANVVVTHHLPHQRSVHKQYAGSPLNAYFVCEVPELREPERLGKKLWIHGHTHSSVRYRLGEVEVVCNPFGYAVEEENRDFDPLLTVEVP